MVTIAVGLGLLAVGIVMSGRPGTRYWLARSRVFRESPVGRWYAGGRTYVSLPKALEQRATEVTRGLTVAWFVVLGLFLVVLGVAQVWPSL